MSNLHWHCYSFLEKIFNHMADFATDFGNVNVVSKGRPISDLNIQPIIRAARTMKAFEDNLTLHQSLDTSITILPSSIKVYTQSPWNKTTTCHNLANYASPRDNKHTGQDNYSRGACSDSASRTNAGDKRNPTTPKGEAKPSQTQHQKKQRHTVANDTPKRQNMDMEMFWLQNPRIMITVVFPANLPEKVCVNFCFRGKECKRENDEACTFLHPCSATDLKLKTIKKIGDHFKDKNIGWFNEYHFMRVPNLKPKYKALMGNKDGPSSLDPSPPPKVSRPIPSFSNFVQDISRRLHNDLVIKIPQKIQTSALSKSALPKYHPKTKPGDVIFPQSNNIPAPATLGLPVQPNPVRTKLDSLGNTVIVRGTTEKRRILDEYEQ
jgi:hypothetical protein